jgi:ABC-2 type transport system ATP-binding protein
MAEASPVASGATDDVIVARGLTRRFGPRVAVDHVDLRIRRGEVFGCLGPNGSGKSTLMRLLLGLLVPSGGEASVLGHRIPQDVESLRPLVGYMTQSFSLYGELTVQENLRFCGEIFGLEGAVLRKRIAEAMAEGGLEPYRDTRAETLSGGWKQRLALAVSTLHHPELLVLDEPTAGVDPQSRREFWARLFALAGSGTTIFVSTHYMDEAVRCHRLCMLIEGRRAALGTPTELTAALEGRVVDVTLPNAEGATGPLMRSHLVESATRLGDSVHVLLCEGAPPPEEAGRRLARELEEAGTPPTRVEPSRPTLEDVFVSLLARRKPGPQAEPEPAPASESKSEPKT